MLNRDRKIVIAGAGLVGSLLALRMAQKGFTVKVYEAHPDLRKNPNLAGRSINLALSHRGIQALKLTGVEDQILKQAIQMQGRMIHSQEGDLQFQPYSSREGESILSISRRSLNIILLDALEKLQPNCVQFQSKLLNWNRKSGDAVFESENGLTAVEKNVILLGTDGANSVARKQLMNISTEIRFNYQQTFQNYGYKELNIPPGPNKEFQLEKNALHIWPRGHFMMIALPNPDATFTCTLFMSFKGVPSLSQLDSDESVNQFFQEYFSDAKSLIENLNADFKQNPTGHLYTVKCEPWHYEDKLVLLGDAAHAIIPFYGQGMNCGFEDVFEFDKMLDSEKDWESLFSKFGDQRKPNSDAIADLAEDNFLEMRDKVADPIFQRKRKLEISIEKKFPQYFSKYALVTFRPDVPYRQAMIKGRKQDDLLMDICKQKENFTDDEIVSIYQQLKELS